MNKTVALEINRMKKILNVNFQLIYQIKIVIVYYALSVCQYYVNHFHILQIDSHMSRI
jgi:hypothetical protein